MREEGSSEEQVFSKLREVWEKDHHFSDGTVLSPMMSTPLPASTKAFSMFTETNLGNPGLYPGTKELEDKVVKSLGELLHAPSSMIGQLTSGGTESNITALWIAKKQTGNKRVLFTRNAHFSLPKACDILSLEHVDIPLDDGLLPDLDILEREIAKGDVACVVGIACTTEFGLLEPIAKMADLAKGSHFHVDAAFGGFVLPFIEPSVAPYDFRLENVSAISIDPHKMGGAQIPAGALLLREKESVGHIAVDSPYLTTDRQSSLLGTRPSAAVAATYAAMETMGLSGYRKQFQECMANTHYLLKKCKEEGIEPLMEPFVNIVVLDVPKPKKVREVLCEKGWFVSNTRKPEGLRIVIMPHVTREVIDQFIPALLDVIDQK